jgi:hypothetical protein
LLNPQHQHWEFLVAIVSSKFGKSFSETLWPSTRMFLVLASPEVINPFRPKLLPEAIRSRGLNLVHGLINIHIYYAFRCAVQSPAWTGTNNGLIFRCIWDTEVYVISLDVSGCMNKVVE